MRQFLLKFKVGNHAGFGWYGPQSRDGVAEISKSEQQNLAVERTVDILALLGEYSDIK